MKPVLDLALVRTLRHVIRNEQIDIVHAHNYEGLLVALAARHRPVVYHAHNSMADELPHFLPSEKGARRLGQWLDRQFPRRADHVIAPHAALAEYLVECGCRSTQISVIPPAMDAAQFDPCEVRDEVPPVLYGGNLDRYQNLDLLFRSMNRVRAAVPSARLVVATTDPRARCLNDAEIVPTPDFQSLKRALAMDAVFACPRVSFSGYPMKLLNAMAAGHAAVACRSAAYPITDAHDGLIVPDNDEVAFAETLLRFLRDPDLRRRLGANARGTILTSHSPAALGDSLTTLYSQLMTHQ